MSWQKKVPKKDTKPERIMRRILERTRLRFASQAGIKTRFREWAYPVDYLVYPRFVIEVDGVYWHSKPTRVKKDEIKKECLKGEGYTVIRFTDKEVEREPNIVEACIVNTAMALKIKPI